MGNIFVISDLSILSKPLYLSRIVFKVILMCETPTAWLTIVWLSVLLVITPIGVHADPTNTISTLPGTHWVVVIRNTRLMQLKQKQALVDTLPELIFPDSAIIDGAALELPAFNPDHDLLSLVFASIHNTKRYFTETRKRYPKIENELYPNGCLQYLTERSNSAKLEHYFMVREAFVPITSKQGLSNLLYKWVMNDSCLFKGLDFNEFIAENAVVPFLRSEYSQPDNTNNTIIVLVNNTEDSLTIDKANKINEFEDSYLTARDFSNDSIIVSPADWVFTVSEASHVPERGLGLGAANNNILIRYLISKATYLPDGFKTTLVKFIKELKDTIDELMSESMISSPDKPPSSLSVILNKYWWIAIIILMLATCIGPLLMYYYTRSKNRICIPE